MPEPAARAIILHQLPSYLGERGVAPDPVFQESGFRACDTATDAVVYRAQVCAVLAKAARIMGDPMVGLSLGLRTEPLRLGRTGVALVHGSTVGQRLRAHTATMPALQTHVRLDVVVEGREAIWRHVLDHTHQDGAWLLYEGASAFTVRVLRSWIGPSWHPSEVRFPHACRGSLAAYEAMFGGNVRFGVGEAAEIRFDRRVLDLPVSPAVYEALPEGLRADDRRPLGTFRLRHERLCRILSDMIAARLGHEPVTIVACASTLGLSVRTLQRLLKDGDLTFEMLVDDVRRQRALSALHEAETNVTTLAMALGYSDAAHFARAFRRWTGMSPSVFRTGGADAK